MRYNSLLPIIGAAIVVELGLIAKALIDANRLTPEPWTEAICDTDQNCADLEARLVRLGWIPPAPVFAEDKR